MRHSWVSALVVSLVAALVSFAVVRRTGAPEVPRLEALRDVEWLRKTVELTPAQVKEIDALQPEFSRTLSSCCDRHCKARGQLLGALLASSNGIAGARGYVEEMCRAQADSELATLEHIQRIHDLLTPEQQSRYKDELKKMTCSECPVCASATCGRRAEK